MGELRIILPERATDVYSDQAIDVNKNRVVFRKNIETDINFNLFFQLGDDQDCN